MAEILQNLWEASSYDKALAACEQAYSTPFNLLNFVDGSFHSSQDPLIDSYNPQTGRVFAKVPNTPEDGVRRAVTSAANAFPTWAKTSRSQRSALLNRIADSIAARRDAFAAWESIDQGKTFERAKVEIERAEANFR